MDELDSGKARYIVALIALAAALSTGALLYLRPSRASIRVIDLRHGSSPFAIEGTVVVPEAYELRSEGGASLRVVDTSGKQFTVKALRSGHGAIKFRIPGGYPGAKGNARLQLVVAGTAIASADLGPLPVSR